MSDQRKTVNTINRMIDRKLLKVYGSMICRIVNFDHQAMRADVQPLMGCVNQDGSVTPFGIIGGIPVEFIFAGGFYIRPDYQSGDLVSVKFYKYDNIEPLQGNNGRDDSLPFNPTNASVTGGIAPTGWTPPAEFSKAGLLIGEKTGNSYMQFTASGIKMIFGTTTITFSASGMAVNENGTNYDFILHIHPTPNGPSGTQEPQ